VGFELTFRGEAFASASAAKPVFRKTADTLLQQFLERLDSVHSNPDYAYGVESAVLFGSMLSEVERLGDVDIAIELLPRVAEEAEFRKWFDRRRDAAREQGSHFRSTFDWIFWPREEIFQMLRSRSRTLSLHGIHDLAEMEGVRYRVLCGDPNHIAALIPGGQPC
jgi:predicted nucleotidyltransferase